MTSPSPAFWLPSDGSHLGNRVSSIASTHISYTVYHTNSPISDGDSLILHKLCTHGEIHTTLPNLQVQGLLRLLRGETTMNE